jgi:hypothetical protein
MLFNPAEIQEIENQVIVEHQLARLDKKYYFHEAVAQILYADWQKDHSDNRIILYCLPLVKSIMVSKHNLLVSKDISEVFQTCCVELMEELPKYRKEKGRIYTYMTMMIFYKIYDLTKPAKYTSIPIEDYDEPYSNDAIFQFNDFISFLQKLKVSQGKTSSKILTSMMEIIQSKKILFQKQDQLIDLICTQTKLPDVLVRQYFYRVLERYFHSVLD